MLDWAIDQNEWPVAVRAPRNGVFYADGEADTDYSELNKYKITKNGEKIAVIALGDFYQPGESLTKQIKEKHGFEPTLINPRFITGLDEKLLTGLKDNHKAVITLEDGILDGGFGQKIASFYGNADLKVLNYGLKKEFLDRYNVNEILEKNRIREDLILEDIESLNVV